MAKGYKIMSERDFTQITQLVNLGLSNKQIEEITKRSSGVVSLVKSTKDWADYQSKRRQIRAKYQESHKVDGSSKTPEQVNLPVAEQPIEQEDSKIYRLHWRVAVASERTADALERLAAAWEAQPEKKRGLFN